MKAMQIGQYGTPKSTLTLQLIEKPEIAADEVLVKVATSGLNPVDWKICNGYLDGFLPVQFPLTLGWDLAGEIVAVGSEVTTLKIGDQVYSMPEIGKDGSLAEFTAVKASAVAKKPQSASMLEAAAYPLATLTSWQAMFNIGQLSAGQRVLIHAGAGGVGHLAIQLAKAKGAVVVTTTSEKNIEFVRQLGADEIIDYRSENFEHVLAGNKVDLVFDTLGGEAQTASWSVIKQGGKLVSITGFDENSEELANQHKVEMAFVFVQGNAEQLTHIAELIDSGKVKVDIQQTFQLDEAVEALSLSEAGRVRGKLVVEIS